MKIKHALEVLDIEVRYDEDDIEPGAELRDSISSLIQTTDFTVPIISRSSLTSPWVVWELSQKKAIDKDRLVPIYIDNAFLEDSYHSSLFDMCNSRIERIDKEINLRQERGQSLESVARDRELWLDYQGKLDRLIGYLAALNVVDLSQSNFKKGVADLCYIVTGERPSEDDVIFFPSESFGNTDIKERKKQIFRHVASNLVSDAVRDMLTLAEDLDEVVENITMRAVLISQRFHDIEAKYNIEGKEEAYLDSKRDICAELLKVLDDLPNSPHGRAA